MKAVCAMDLNHTLRLDFQVVFITSRQRSGMGPSPLREQCEGRTQFWEAGREERKEPLSPRSPWTEIFSEEYMWLSSKCLGELPSLPPELHRGSGCVEGGGLAGLAVPAEGYGDRCGCSRDWPLLPPSPEGTCLCLLAALVISVRC